VGTNELLHRMCPRCRFEYRSEDLLGTLNSVWTELWRRIEADDRQTRGLDPLALQCHRLTSSDHDPI
jgi:hypothetical protein